MSFTPRAEHALVSIAEKMDPLIEGLNRLQPPAPEVHIAHLPAIAPAGQGRFGVFCAACSEAAQDYIYPCKDGAWPAGEYPRWVLAAADEPEPPKLQVVSHGLVTP